MSNTLAQNTTLRILLSLAAFVIIIAGMRAAEEIIAPFLLSIFFTIMFAPPLMWLQDKNIPTAIALGLVISCIILVQLTFFSLVSASLQDFSQALPSYEARLTHNTNALNQRLHGYGIDMSENVIGNYFNPETIIDLVAKGLGSVGSVLSNTFLILLLVIFMLLEAASFPTKLRLIFKKPDVSLAKLSHVVQKIKRYIAIKTVMSLITGLLITFWLMILGVDYALLFGVLAFFLNYVPNIGSLIAAIPAVLLASLQLGGWFAVYTAMGYVLVNNVLGNMIEPRIMGRTLGLSTLVVFLSLLFWGWVLGAVGMLLSIPLTMTAKLILETSDNTRWLAILLESDTEAQETLEKEKAENLKPAQ